MTVTTMQPCPFLMASDRFSSCNLPFSVRLRFSDFTGGSEKAIQQPCSFRWVLSASLAAFFLWYAALSSATNGGSSFRTVVASRADSIWRNSDIAATNS
jgi:hypothetical protein